MLPLVKCTLQQPLISTIYIYILCDRAAFIHYSILQTARLFPLRPTTVAAATGPKLKSLPLLIIFAFIKQTYLIESFFLYWLQQTAFWSPTPHSYCFCLYCCVCSWWEAVSVRPAWCCRIENYIIHFTLNARSAHNQTHLYLSESCRASF